MAITHAMVHLISFIFGSRVGFLWLANQMVLLPFVPNQRWWLVTVLKISNGHNLFNGSPDLLHVCMAKFAIILDTHDGRLGTCFTKDGI